MQSITTYARYASIANTNISGRPNGTIIVATWTSGRRFNAHANYNNGNITMF
jgi:hypothetical protein